MFPRPAFTPRLANSISMDQPKISAQGDAGSSSALAPFDFLVPGIIVVEGKSRTATVTEEAARILGWTSSPEAGAAFEQLPAPLRQLAETTRMAHASPARQRLELGVNHRGPVSLSVLAVALQPGAADSPVVLSVGDLTWVRPFEERLRRLDRLANAGTLAASMAHEIKNALVASRTFIELLLEKNPDAELAGVVRRELERIDAMISRMLKFAAPSPARFGRVRVHEVLEHSLRLVQPQVTDKSIAVQRSFGAGADQADGDEYELEQAFVNLLLNALEAMGANGRLTVATETIEAGGNPVALREPAAPCRIRITIQDTGHGISPENMQRLFEPFFTTKPSGTGLGLAVTDRIVRAHNGTIQAASRPGEGSTFTITLPRAPGSK